MASTSRKITKEKYNKIKKETKVPADDAKVVEKFRISLSTARKIRNTQDYQEYCERVFRYHGYPRRGQVLYRTTIDDVDRKKETRSSASHDEDDDPMKQMRAVVLMTVLPLFIVALVAVILACAGGK